MSPSNISPSNTVGRNLLLVASALAIALSGGFAFISHVRARRQDDLQSDAAAAAGAPPEVNVVAVKYAPATQLLTLPGETAAWYQTTIYARVSGYVANWTADIGDRVKQGQTLAAIDTPELDDQLVAAQAKLKVSQANVTVMQANAELARSNYQRWADSPKGVVSELEQEEKKAASDSSAAQLLAAGAQVNLDQADIDRLTELTHFKSVKAPFDGIITARRIDIGDLITAGSTASTTSLYTIAQADKIRVFVEVPQSASAILAADMSAVATAAEFPGRKFQGKVARTSRALNPSSRTLRVEVDLPNPDLTLLPGMYVQVSFELPQPSQLQIPASAILFRSAGTQVAVVADDHVKFQPVTIAADLGDVINIASGLDANDRVALNISDQIAEGDRVSARDAESTPASPALADRQTP